MILNPDHITLASCHTVKAICQPLSKLMNLKYFSYARGFKKGGHIHLSTYPEWEDYFYKNEYLSLVDIHQTLNFYKIIYMLPSQWCNNKNISIINKAARNCFNLDYGLMIIRDFPEYLEFSHTTAEKCRDNMDEFYLVLLPQIERFLDYFAVRAENLIKDAERQKIFLPAEYYLPPLNRNQALLSSQKLEEFNNSIKIDKLYLTLIDEKINLSKRESECLYLLIQGYTAKEIARKLNLSPRTVEEYIDNTRRKTNSRNRTELASKILGVDY